MIVQDTLTSCSSGAPAQLSVVRERFTEPVTNQITELTRRDIFDYIRVTATDWAGRLPEADFLSRIYDVENMPSTDGRFKNAYGDIWQHRINNDDWDADWVFSDSRFQLNKGDDSIFLRFLCEMIHPVVRSDKEQVAELVQAFNSYLKHDGYQLVEKTRISGRPVYAARRLDYIKDKIRKRIDELYKSLNTEYVLNQITSMEASIETAPHIAIGLSKELIETSCKSILKEHGTVLNPDWDLPRLMKETAKLLKLTPEDITDEKKGATTIKQILGSLTSVVHGLSELRNEYGAGHGKDKRFKGLQVRHARLAVGAASTLAIFLLETHEIRK